MNSFLSLSKPILSTTTVALRQEAMPPRPPLIYKAPVYKAPAAAASDPARWGVWGAAYGGQNNTTGDALDGSHAQVSARTFGIATGLDYRVTPSAIVGLALSGGGRRIGFVVNFDYLVRRAKRQGDRPSPMRS